VFEETVASVFRDLGYGARVTAYSGDDGIDVILDGQSDTMIGVQVKRYRNSIQVEQIRSLAGALVLGGLTRGIFVTTSTFQGGADDTAQRLNTRGYQIELMDATRFFDALKIAQRSQYRSKSDPTAPYTHARLIDLHYSTGSY
jgi:restriction system protein